MLEMFLYGASIMYTPGPVNIMGFNLGLNKKFKHSIGYFFGVGVAMLILFLLYGYTGEKIIKKEYLLYLSFVGTIYILYLSYKVYKSKVDFYVNNEEKIMTFKNGFFMQLFNPKASLATLPIATINFTSNNITGSKIFFMSIVLSLLVIGAPSTYCMMGQFFNKVIDNNKIIRLFNIFMALLLIYVAISIFIEHVLLVLLGKKPY